MTTENKGLVDWLVGILAIPLPNEPETLSYEVALGWITRYRGAVGRAATRIRELEAEVDEARESKKRTREWLADAQHRAGERLGRTIAAEARCRKLKEALSDAADTLDWAARRMKGRCSGSDVSAVMLAAGRATEARALLDQADGEKNDG